MTDINAGISPKTEKLYELTPASSALAIDLSKFSSFNFKWEHTDGDVVTFSNPPIGVSLMRLLITNPGDGTDIVFSPTMHEAGGTEPTWTAVGLDIVTVLIVNDGTTVTYYQLGIIQAVAD